MISDNISTLPIPPRPGDQPFLMPVPSTKCQHLRVSFEVDVKAGKCFCGACGEEVSPMYVLEMLMHEESRWKRAEAEYHDNMRRLKERSRTRCQHCGQMTRISDK